MHFSLNSVRNKGFQQHSPKPFKSYPKEVASLIYNDNLAKPALLVFSKLENAWIAKIQCPFLKYYRNVLQPITNIDQDSIYT